MTNYERYFGTPERAAKTTVQRYGRPERVAVEHRNKQVADIPSRKYKMWLESEAEDD